MNKQTRERTNQTNKYTPNARSVATFNFLILSTSAAGNDSNKKSLSKPNENINTYEHAFELMNVYMLSHFN